MKIGFIGAGAIGGAIAKAGGGPGASGDDQFQAPGYAGRIDG